MPNILNSEVIRIEPSDRGNRVLVLVTAMNKRMAKRRARAEASDVMMIRSQESINVYSVTDMTAMAESGSVKSVDVEHEAGVVKDVNVSDVKKLYTGVLTRLGSWELRFVPTPKKGERTLGVKKRFSTEMELLDFKDTYLVVIEGGI